MLYHAAKNLPALVLGSLLTITALNALGGKVAYDVLDALTTPVSADGAAQRMEDRP